jgi:hypothetical protein
VEISTVLIALGEKKQVKACSGMCDITSYKTIEESPVEISTVLIALGKKKNKSRHAQACVILHHTRP